MRLPLAAILFASPLGLACPSVSTVGSARTLPKGAVEGMISPGLYGQPRAFLPTFQGGIRRGVTDRLEIGGRLWFIGAQVEAKVGLLRPESARSGLNLSLLANVGYAGLGGFPIPGIGYAGSVQGGGSSPTTNSLHLALGLLAGYRLFGHELTFGPRAISSHLFRGEQQASVISVGGSLGIRVRIIDRVHVVPELSVLYPVKGDFSLSDMDPGIAPRGAPIFSLGIGVTYTQSPERSGADADAAPVQDEPATSL